MNKVGEDVMHVFVVRLPASGGRGRDGQSTEGPPGQSEPLWIPPPHPC